MKGLKTLRLIEKIVCNHNLVDLGYIFQKTNEMRVVKIRQQFEYVAYTFLKGKVSLADIGRYRVEVYGYKKGYHHTSVRHSREIHKNLISYNKKVKAHTDAILDDIEFEEAKHRLVLLTARNYFQGKLDKMIEGMYDCKNNEDFDKLLLSSVSKKGKIKYNIKT